MLMLRSANSQNRNIMLFLEFSRCCEELEGISGRLDMIDVISRVLPGLSQEELPVFVRFIMGRIFPDWSSKKLDIGPNLLYESVGYVVGIKKEQVINRKINQTGDVGRAVEELLSKKITFPSRCSFPTKPTTSCPSTTN